MSGWLFHANKALGSSAIASCSLLPAPSMKQPLSWACFSPCAAAGTASGPEQLSKGENQAAELLPRAHTCAVAAQDTGALLLLFPSVLALTRYLCSTETNRQLLPKCAKYDPKPWRQMGRSERRLAAPLKPAPCPGGD